MDKAFSIRLITPQDKLLEQEASSVVLPAWDGQIGVLPNRAPMVVKLGTGEMKVHGAGQHGGDRTFVVEDGFAQMVGNKLTVLANMAVAAETITETDAMAELDAANARTVPADAANRTDALARITKAKRLAELKLRVAQSRRGRGI
ncbi:MAG: ATP synthase F1 subunit epsilon [Phycisphaeraceae bacterium]|nr:ATP synthase F1 subunit epsilon [Phycisphaerales bacterium]MCB9860218.1 ATP synthase F1 subunit epsilon [Phycisphaeraceae bacterium]